MIPIDLYPQWDLSDLVLIDIITYGLFIVISNVNCFPCRFFFARYSFYDFHLNWSSEIEKLGIFHFFFEWNVTFLLQIDYYSSIIIFQTRWWSFTYLFKLMHYSSGSILQYKGKMWIFGCSIWTGKAILIRNDENDLLLIWSECMIWVGNMGHTSILV